MFTKLGTRFFYRICDGNAAPVESAAFGWVKTESGLVDVMDHFLLQEDGGVVAKTNFNLLEGDGASLSCALCLRFSDAVQTALCPAENGIAVYVPSRRAGLCLLAADGLSVSVQDGVVEVYTPEKRKLANGGSLPVSFLAYAVPAGSIEELVEFCAEKSGQKRFFSDEEAGVAPVYNRRMAL